MGNSNSSSGGGTGAIEKKDNNKREIKSNNSLYEASASMAGRSMESGMTRSESGADIQDRTTTQLIPIEKLAKASGNDFMGNVIQC